MNSHNSSKETKEYDILVRDSCQVGRASVLAGLVTKRYGNKINYWTCWQNAGWL